MHASGPNSIIHVMKTIDYQFLRTEACNAIQQAFMHIFTVFVIKLGKSTCHVRKYDIKNPKCKSHLRQTCHNL